MLYSRFLLGLCLWLCLPTAYSAGFWQVHSEGWHWYHDPAPDRTARSDSHDQKNDPVMRMEQLQQQVKRTLDQAILEPTPEHVKAYLELQNQIAQQASLFSEVWQRILLETPNLDYAIDHPTNQIARQVYWDKRHTDSNDSIHELAKTMGLFFFFKGSCPYCHRFAPIVKGFAEQYEFTIVPISLDGGTLEEFPEVKPNNGAAAQFNVTIVPAVFLVDPKTSQIVPLSYGLISEEELANRVMHVAETLKNKSSTQ